MEYKQSAKPLSKYWEVLKKHETSYSGGQVELIASSNSLACMRDGNVVFLSLETGEVKNILVDENSPESAEEIVCFAIHPNGEEIITASRNQLLRVWNIKERTMERMWKAHDAPIASMAFDPSGKYLITGSSDHTAKVWDVEKGFCTHNFRHSFGVVHLVAFTKTKNPLYAITCCDDHIINIWNLYESKDNQLVSQLKGHLNSVTSLCVCESGLLLSSSRDKTVILWDVLTGQQLKTCVIYEAIETIQAVPKSMYPSLELRSNDIEKSKKKKTQSNAFDDYFFLCGEKGVVHLYHCKSTLENATLQFAFTEVSSSRNDNEIEFYSRSMEHSKEHNNAYYASLFVLKNLIVNAATNCLYGVTNSNNFKQYECKEGDILFSNVIVGNNDEIVDMCYVGDGNHLAVATNSYELRLLFVPTFSSTLLYGHKDTILSIKATTNGSFILTSSRDNTVRLWHTASRMCLASCEGHIQDVSCCALSQRPHAISKSLITMLFKDALKNDCNHRYKKSEWDQALQELTQEETNTMIPDFWLSASEDKTIKLWDLASVSDGVIRGAKITVKAHEKSINAICVAPNDKLAASGSMDKTIKLWSLPDMTNYMTLTGHKKGVWDVSFSTLNSILLSSSGDQTLRVWNIKDGSTLYTIEGFDHSLLKSAFLSGNQQIVSCDNTGIIKVNTVASKECVTTIDAHDDKIWALAIPQDKSNQFDTFATGSADGQIKIWRDCTTETEEMELLKKEELFMREQEFQKALQSGDYHRALVLALELDKPYNFRLIIEKIMKGEYEQHVQVITDLLKNLEIADLTKLFSYIREWNLVSRTFVPAQVVLSILLHTYPFEMLMKIKDIEEFVDTLMAYNKRHLERTDRLLQNSYLVDYLLQHMDVLESDTSVKRYLEGEDSTEKRVKL